MDVDCAVVATDVATVALVALHLELESVSDSTPLRALVPIDTLGGPSRSRDVGSTV